MLRALVVVFCLVFSGLSALIYQIIWTRLLGFAFGTTTEAISTVLAIFFGGLALGSWIAAGRLGRVRRPLRLYALLELGIGLFAAASLPGLRRLDLLYAFVGVEHGAAAMTVIRVIACAALLLPPTIAMGATLPLVVRALVTSDARLGRWSAFLYTANTLGAVLGAYLCGFWLIPKLGMTHSVLMTALLNLGVAVVVLTLVRGRENVCPERATDGTPAATRALATPDAAAALSRGTFLALFGVSGFVAIGYEIVWSKVFGIVMEGTLYGFAAVLSSFLLGIGLGSLAIAPWVDRIRNLARAFGLLHVGIAASVALGLVAVPYLPYAHQELARLVHGLDPLHLLFSLVAPIVLLPTSLFGAAFPILIRIYTRNARHAGEGVGRASAVNTAGSIVGSLFVGFWAIPILGMDATLFGLLLLELGIALLVLVALQTESGRGRAASSALATLTLLALCLSFNGVQVDKAIAGRETPAATLRSYADALEERTASIALRIEGRSSIVTLYESPTARLLRSNGLPESGFSYRPPYYSLETVLLGVVPYLMAESTERALVIGLGGGNTVTALRRTAVAEIEVVELERGIVEAVGRLHAGRENPLDDPRVRLRINDGRNELLLGHYRGDRGYDLIASQPSHPWLQGSANLFTEEFFALARENLSEGGVFALWVNGFRTDPESVLAIVTSFERIFPGSLLVDGSRGRSHPSLLLLGGTRPLRLDPIRAAQRGQRPALRELLGLFGIETLEDLLAQFHGPAAAFAAIDPEAKNTDDDAYVETRIPRRHDWSSLEFARIEARLAANAPVLPPLDGPVDVEAIARALLDSDAEGSNWAHEAKLLRLLRVHGQTLDPSLGATLRAEARLRNPAQEAEAAAALRELAALEPPRAEPARALGRHLHRRGRFRDAARFLGQAHRVSSDPQDAYEAGASFYRVSPSEAWAWFGRIPESERVHFPRLAYYTAARAVAQGATRVELATHLEALKRYRDTEEGRGLTEVDRLLSRLAEALGDPVAARAYADAAHRQRQRRAAPLLRRGVRALEKGNLPEARRALSQARALLPGDPKVSELWVRLAIAGGENEALASALGEIRHFASSLSEAVAEENRLRAERGRPLLPERSAGELVAPGR